METMSTFDQAHHLLEGLVLGAVQFSNVLLKRRPVLGHSEDLVDKGTQDCESSET